MGLFDEQSYNTGRSWHLDRQKHNKSEDWEKPMDERKQSYAEGGGVDTIKFYEIANILDLDLEYDGDETDLRLHGEEKLNWGAETAAEYEEATNAIDAISYKGNGWEVYATYDVSGFDYWMMQQEEQNYLTMTIMFDNNTVDVTEITAIKNAMDMAYSDAYSIAEKYDYVPNSEYKRGGSINDNETIEVEIVQDKAYGKGYYVIRKYGTKNILHDSIEGLSEAYMVADNNGYEVIYAEGYDNDDEYKRGGKVDGRSTRDKSTWNSGAAWTRDRNAHNKSEDWEKPLNQRGKSVAKSSSISSSASSKGKSKKYMYIPNYMIRGAEVNNSGKTTDIDGDNILDGIYVKKGTKYAEGGGLDLFVTPKGRNVEYKGKSGGTYKYKWVDMPSEYSKVISGNGQFKNKINPIVADEMIDSMIINYNKFKDEKYADGGGVGDDLRKILNPNINEAINHFEHTSVIQQGSKLDLILRKKYGNFPQDLYIDIDGDNSFTLKFDDRADAFIVYDLTGFTYGRRFAKSKYADGGGVESLISLGQGKYKYRDFQFRVEDGEINMTSPDFYEGQSIEGETPTLNEIKSIIADYFDFDNRDFPITKAEATMINKNFSTKEQDEIFGMTFTKYADGGGVPDLDKKMALVNLDMIHEYSVKLDNMVTEETELEEWVKMKLTRIEQNIADVKHAVSGGEKFDGGGMIFKKQLLHISKYAKELIDMVQAGSNLMAWQENKLAIAADNIDGIYHYMDYLNHKNMDKFNEYLMRANDEYKRGGKVPRNVGRDWMFKSKQKWEQDYDRKREYKEYKKEGWLANWFKDGGEAKEYGADEIGTYDFVYIKSLGGKEGMVMEISGENCRVRTDENRLAEKDTWFNKSDLKVARGNNERLFAKGGRVKNYKYVPNYMIESVDVERNGKTTEIDGGNILDGLYVKGKVNFEEGGYVENIPTETLEAMIGRKLNGWNDDKVIFNGIVYKKCFMKPYYKIA